ncbi:MAG TPA: prephenate dehydrogenase/arogenate dehydrogenase family protein [Thiobacillaceae bacterium]|nr:prephenate dehydrogenase/arogenate dehydrogenase family protein [Thiobacillaceae bacterium]
MIRRLAVIGVGLIGGSLALALRRKGMVKEVVGCGRGRANLEQAEHLGIIDRIADTPAEAVIGADMVFVAVPVGAMPALFAAIAPVLEPDGIVTDAGSTKSDVVEAARRHLGERVGRFVPAHPIAGAEKSGARAARPELFKDKHLIITPLADNAPADIKQVRTMWQACGAQVEEMPPEVHDRVFAAVSHLPHLAAFALMEELAGREEADVFFRYAGSGFRDFTRIAGSHPEMWRDIALANHLAVLAELDLYIDKLKAIRGLIERADGPSLEELFARARGAREQWIKHKQP